MTAGVTPVDAPTVPCANPRFRKVVDRSFEKGGAEAQNLIARYLCPFCPIREECYELGAAEHGTWGGVSRRSRTNAGQTPVRVGNAIVNMQGVHQLRGRNGRGEAA